LAKYNPRRYLEIGSYEGRSAVFMLNALGQLPGGHVTCIDTWEGSADLPPQAMLGVEERFRANTRTAIAQTPHFVQLRAVKSNSRDALVGLLAAAELFDFVYIDGSHVAADVLSDAVLSFHLLHVGGLLVFDDYLWSAEPIAERNPL